MKPIRDALARLPRSHRGEERPFALRVDVRHGKDSGHAALQARGQAKAAAAGAAGVMRAFLDGEVADPGAWMPEQVIESERFFSRLARDGLRVALRADADVEP